MMGARIAALRRAAGMSQAQLAEKLKISSSSVGMYEQDRRQPSLDVVVSVSEILGVSIDFLVKGEPVNDAERDRIQRLLLDRVETVDHRLGSRGERPMSRQELAVLFAAMLMEP